MGREGCYKQITLACARSVSATLGLPLLKVLTAQALGCSAGNRPRPALGLHAPPRSKPLRFRHSGSPQRRRLGWACVLCPSQVWVAQVFDKRGRCNLSPLPSLLLSFLRVQPAYLLRRTFTIQNPKKTWLEMKPACSNLAWRMSGTKKPGGLPSKGLHRVRHD